MDQEYGAIIVADQKWLLPGIKVVTWHDHGMEFDKEQAPRRMDAIRQMVIHWTGSERHGEEGAAQIYRSLCNRGLSVEFVTTNEGTLWQFVDPVERRCRHASRVNPFAIGLEVSCKGWMKPGLQMSEITALRPRYVAEIHRWKTRFFGFFPEQQRTINTLATALIKALDIEPVVMTEPWKRRSNKELESFSGFLGHLHAIYKGKSKTDPGTMPLLDLEKYLAGVQPRIKRG